MKSAGAVKVNDKWTYENKPIELNVFIDNETKDSKEMAEIISTELEGVGFTVNKNYYNRSDENFKSPTYTTDPNELKWNFDITSWIYYGASKYTSFGFPGLYEPKGGWKYENKKIKDVEEQMKSCETEAKWAELNRKLTDLHLNDSVGIWLVAKEGLSPARSTVKGLINDKYIGLRFLGNIRQAKNKNSNTLTIGSEYLYEAGSSWNPVVIESIGMIDVVNAIHDPARWTDNMLETKPFRWGYSIKSADDINVPADAFVWNVNKNKWDNVAEGTKAKAEITLDLSKYLDTTWHNGRKISWGDVLYFIASTWDRSYDKTKQKISDDGWQDYFDGLQGLKISGNNLIVYLDRTDFDKDNLLLFPKLFQRIAPLEIYAGSDKLVFGNKGFQYGEIEDEKLEKLNLTNKDHVAKIFAELDSINYSEIEPFVSVNGTSYFSEERLTNRKKALTDWYNAHGHLIISDGPFYLDRYNVETGDITMKAFRDESYPFTKGNWFVK
jgi:peptide/nickel transport system substrate-binding protein